jgi:methylated-DNA-[protein]-cysteine S-methyltransferase
MIESNPVYYSVYRSPVGELLLTSERGMLSGLSMPLQQGKPAPSPKPQWRRDDEALRVARQQLDAYFEGDLHAFDLALHMVGTPFQKQVWQGLLTIPYGTTISYAELARRIGRPRASRAVGAANGRNPIGIIVPCHRVIGADGSLTGYGGGLDCKEWLLSHEGGGIIDQNQMDRPRRKLHPKEGAPTLTGCL